MQFSSASLCRIRSGSACGAPPPPPPPPPPAFHFHFPNLKVVFEKSKGVQQKQKSELLDKRCVSKVPKYYSTYTNWFIINLLNLIL